MTQLLNHKTFGEKSDQPTLIVAHGLYGSMRNWQGLARNLSADRQVITVDMRNHAGSFYSDAHSYFDLAEDLGAICLAQDGPVDLLGHSMGGKAAMVLAMQHPEALSRLIVADIAPVTYDHNPGDNIEIMQSLDISSFTRRSEAEAAMKETVADPAVRAFIAQSLIIEPATNRWALNLDALATNMPDIVGFPCGLTGVFAGPTLFVRGEKSDYVLDRHRPLIERHFPHAQIVDIANAGHWVHAENPRDFLTSVKAFLEAA